MQTAEQHPWDLPPKALIVLLGFQFCIWKTRTILLLTYDVGCTPPKIHQVVVRVCKRTWKEPVSWNTNWM